MAKRALLVALVVTALLGCFLTQPAMAQDTPPIVYDHAWLVQTASQPNGTEQLVLVWAQNQSNGMWTSQGSGGTFDVPANSAVLAPDMSSGNTAAFQQVGTGIWFTGQGGRFGTSGQFRAFQLAPLGVIVNQPLTIDEVVVQIKGLTHDKQIETLDVMWATNSAVINQWGTSGPAELLTGQQVASLAAANLPLEPVIQVISGNSIVWGELAADDVAPHWGLVMIAPDVYLTTCEGGQFVTLKGFRAMQFAPAAPNAIISDTTGCNGVYPLLDLSNIVSVTPLDKG